MFNFLGVMELITDERLRSEFEIHPIFYHTAETEPTPVYVKKESYRMFSAASPAEGNHNVLGLITGHH